MVFEFKLPDIGEGVHEGEISRWLVRTGQQIKEDQPMVEVMTDKVTVEITSPVTGIVKQLNYNEGETVKVGNIIISIDDSLTLSADSGKTLSANDSKHTMESEISASVVKNDIKHDFTPVSVLPENLQRCGKVLAAPAVRKLARSMGINLELVTGSGPQGRIRKPDLLSFQPNVGTKQGSVYPSAPATMHEDRVPFIGMRRKIGEHLVKSKHTAPHFTYVEEADMTDIVKLRNDLSDYSAAYGVKLTFLPFIIKAVIEGLKKFPQLNSMLDESSQEVVLKRYYNIGVAVATPNGLVVPVVKHADQKSLVELAAEISELGDKARNNRLALADLQGGTFTLTSIGSIGGIFSAPIINYPEVAIMGIQKIEKRPVVRNDQIVIREMSYLSISCDHRVVDGAEAAMFMKELIEWLEHPGRWLLSVK